MRKLTLYIETSVFGFYYDDRLENRIKKQCTIKLFKQIGEQLFEAYYSPVTLAEIQKTPDVSKRKKLLDLIVNYKMKELLISQSELQDIEIIATKLIKSGVIPQEKRDDALHFAIVALHPEIDYLVTWNCHHIANEIVFKKVKSIILSAGYEVKFDVTTPEEIIYYEE